MDFCFDGVIKQWNKHLSQSNKALIFSPYLTSPTAESIVKDVKSVNCEIYTQFTEEIFINQSSSINTLIKLKNLGCILYHLPNLHAKMVIIPHQFASMGSQNITNQGQRNLEANVVFEEPYETSQLLYQAFQWKELAQELSLDTLQEMKHRVEPFIEEYQTIINNCKNRELPYRKTKNRSREKKLADFVNITTSINEPDCLVKSLVGSYNWETGYQAPGTKSLVPRHSKADLSTWEFEDSIEELNTKERYGLWLSNTAKFGWARLGKSRITYISDGLHRLDETYSIEGHECTLEFEAIWDDDRLLEDRENINVIIHPNDEERSKIVCQWRFTPNSNKILSINYQEPYKIHSNEILQWIRKNNADFENLLLQALLLSFKYEEKLNGVDAEDFFGGLHQEFQLCAHKIKDYPLLVANPSNNHF